MKFAVDVPKQFSSPKTWLDLTKIPVPNSGQFITH